MVDLWAPGAGRAAWSARRWSRWPTELAGQIKLVKVDVDISPRSQQRFEVQAVPTLLVLRDGQVVARQSGAAPAAELRTWVEAAIGS